jgi:hypothetical protein
MPVLQLADTGAGFFAGVRLGLIGPARSESLIAFVPARTAVRVIAFSVLWSALLQTVDRLRLTIHRLSLFSLVLHADQ